MTTAGSAKKPNVFNEASEALYDPYVGIPIGGEFAKIPWPEWSDADLNAEEWDGGKIKPSSKTKTDTAEPNPLIPFEDPEVVDLLPKVKEKIFSWKRPHEVFPDSVLTVYDPTNQEFELHLPSPVAKCDFLKSFMELLPLLQFYATKHELPVELETPAFVPTTQGETWRPWHHIYAFCKAGKGQAHKPLHSQYGKYVLRLFYMGTWRKFLIDDRIPCDEFGNCMFPVTQVPGELWPILLVKGLLKIALLTRCEDLHMVDFPLLTLFTGWVDERISMVNKTDEQIWRRLLVFVPRYELPKEETELKTAPTSVKDFTSKIGSSKKASSKSPDNKAQINLNKFCFVLATVKDIFAEETPAVTYPIGVTMVRDLPLIKVEKREATKAWKRIRWIYWASKKGLWTDELKLPPYRRLECVTFIRNLLEFLALDPKEEAAIFNIPFDSKSDHHLPESEDTKLNPLQWSDFCKFRTVLLRLNVLFKPSVFSSSFRVTSLKEETDTLVNTKGVKAPPKNLYYQSPTLHANGNEPAILFCESSTGIFLCFSLWVCPRAPQRSVGYTDYSHPEILKVSNATLIIERYDWRTLLQGELLGLVKTVGNTSFGLNLKPGRHVLKMWLDSDSPYLIDTYSNVELCVNKGPKIRFLMNNEAERVKNYIDNVSDAFITLTLKFGKPDTSSALRNFYETIKPGNDSAVGYLSKMDEFIETFLLCILLSLKVLVPSMDELKIMMAALQSLFLNPYIQCESLKGGPPSSFFANGKKTGKKIISAFKERTLSEILSHPWTTEDIEKVIFIQRVFRGFRVRLLRRYQTPTRKEFKPYNDRLKKICDLIFIPTKREAEVGRIIRMIIRVNVNLLETFRFHKDLPNVIEVEEFTGRIPNIEPFNWVPIARFIIACHCDDPAPCSFYFSSNLEHFVILGVNNDTSKELFRLINSVSPHYYQCNDRGYTVFVFGWNESNAKTINWRLEMVKMKHSQAIHLCNTLMGPTCHPYSIPSLEISEVKNFYVPNYKSRVCRCLIKIQKLSLLTLRLFTSYPQAQFVLTISLDKRFCVLDSESSNSGQVIVQVNSTNGAALVPSVFLKHIESTLWWGEASTETSTLYVLEAFITNNSWPLTKQEWGVVEPIRVNGENWKENSTNLHSKKGASESRKRLTRTSKRGLSEQKFVENPFWVIQVLSDSSEPSDSVDAMVVEEDKTYAESIKAMKKSWEERDPRRSKRGRELRLKFLYDIFQEENTNDAEGFIEEEGEDKESFKNLIDRMSNFSYLTNDNSPTRYLKSPRVLPRVPTNELLLKYKRKNINLADYDSEKDASNSSMELVRNMADEMEEDKKDFFEGRVHFRLVMAEYLLEEQTLSTRLMEEAYEGRSKTIERLAR